MTAQGKEASTNTAAVPVTKLWIVKSASRVLGPYSSDELMVLVKMQHVSPLDEVCPPLGRWKYLREEAEFSELIKSMRTEYANMREDTMTSTATAATPTQTISITQSPETKKKGKGTATPVEAPVREVSSQAMGPGGRPAGAKSYTFERDAKVGQKSLLVSIFAWVTALGAVAVLGGIVWTKHNQSLIKDKETFDDLFKTGLVLKSQGQFRKAFENFKKAESLNQHSPELIVEMAPIMMALDSQTIMARRMIEPFLIAEQSRTLLTMGYHIIGLSYLLDEDYKNADDYFEKAVGTDPNFKPSVLDRAILKFRTANYETSLQLFKKADDLGSDDGLRIIGQALSLIEGHKKGTFSENELLEFRDILKKYAERNYDYRQEAQLLQAVIEVKTKDVPAAQTTVDTILRTPPDLTSHHLHDLLVDRRIANWPMFFSYCDLVHRNLPQIPVNHMFLGYCLTRAGKDADAKKSISQALAQAPQDPLIQTVNSFVLHQTGHDDEAKASLHSAMRNERSVLALVLKGSQCETDKDYACSDETWKALLEMQPGSLEAINGMAWSLYRKQKNSDAREWVNRGLNVSAKFLPLLELKGLLDAR